MHGSDSWGNATAQADVLDLYALLSSRSTITKVVLIGGSMGGIAAANIAAAGTLTNLSGVYCIDAALSLSAMFAANAGTYSASIRTGYGIAADGSDYASKTSGFDPLLKSSNT